MPQSYLVVPVELDALVVNKGVLGRDTFRWWQFNYKALDHYKSPEPLALDRSSGGPGPGVHLHWELPRALRHGVQHPQTGVVEYPLVPNRWMIVRFGGTQQRKVTGGWVLESDCPKAGAVTVDTALTSMYLIDPSVVQTWLNSADPVRKSFQPNTKPNQPQVTNIGVPFPLGEGAQGWSERAPQTMFLTAVAPGNHAFSIYYPHNRGVFSFYDDLEGIDNDTLSYLVVGWYSDPRKDILASWPQDKSSGQPYQDLLSSLRWDVAGDSKEQATASLYEGMVFSVGWQRNGNPPGTEQDQPQTDALQQIRDTGLLNVAVGNTTIDAFSALVAQQLKAHGHDPQKVKLLQAFQYDRLPVLNEVNGDALLDEQIRQAWHGSKPGGYVWAIVDKESDGGAAADLTDAEAAWLLQLNVDQAALDAALVKLYDLQWNLNAAWYRLGWLSDAANVFPKPPAGVADLNKYKAQLSAQLNAGGAAPADSLVNQVLGQVARVQGLMGKVPQPDPAKPGNQQDAFQAGIQNFARQKNLSADKVLKSLPGARYWKANNPVVVISGVEPAQAVDPNTPLPVRLTSSLVTGFDAGKNHPVDRNTVGNIIPVPGNLPNLPPPVPALVREYFFLDPAGAASIAATIGQPAGQVAAVMTGHQASDYQGTLPAVALGPWRQPWNPMYLEWQVSYTHIPYLTGDSPNWTFDGTDYHFTPGSGSPAADRPRDIGGISLFSPVAQFVFGSRLKAFVDKYGSETDMKNLFDWISEIDQWKFLSQELVGFNETLALRDDRAFRSPSAQDTVKAGAAPYPVADLAGYPGITPGAHGLPDAYRGQVNTVPFIPNGPKIPFRGARQGQIYFANLNLYDKFGRVLYVIQSGQQSGLYDMKNFPLVRDPALFPDTQLDPNIKSVAQLPPRALQFSRLDFDLVDGKEDAKVLGADAGVNPVAGWVLPNHLDNSILIYAPDGASLGEFRLLVNDRGVKVGRWQAPPHSAVNTLDDVGKAAPHLLRMLEAAQIKDEKNFQTFLGVIDSTLWTIDPLGGRADQNLSVLIGRPLALVRARLRLSLEGPAVKDTGWDVALNPPAPDFLGYEFAVRLGDQATRQDGVIGYFSGDDYGVFNSVAAAGKTVPQDYVRQIGPTGSTAAAGNYIQLRFNETGDGASPKSSAYISLLADPRADIHATAGIVPVKQVNIPARFVEPALANIEISFRIGPLLTAIEQTPSETGQAPPYPNAVSYLAPAEQNGQWSWWENVAGSADWNGYALRYSTPNAEFQSLPNTVRDGLLQLVLNLNKTT